MKNFNKKKKLKRLSQHNNKKIPHFLAILFSIGSFFIFDSIVKTKTATFDEIIKFPWKFEKISIINNEQAVYKIQNTNNIIKVNVPNGEYLEKKMKNTHLENVPVEYIKRLKYSNLILPFCAGLGLLLLLSKGQTNNMMSMTQADPNKLLKTQEEVTTRFKDVIGQEDAINLVNEFVDILKNTNKYRFRC